jgi:flagellar basal body-associated protein FliL
MAGTEAAATSSATPSSGKGKSIALIVGVIVLAAASAAGGAVAYQRLLAPKAAAPAGGEKHAAKAEHAEEAEEEDDSHAEAHGEGHKPPTVQIEAFVVDLRNGEEMHNLRIGLALEMKDPVEKEEEAKEMVKEVTPRARDAAITYLRAVPPEEMTDPAKLEEIRAELVKRIKKAIPKPKVKHVLFTDFVVQ